MNTETKTNPGPVLPVELIKIVDIVPDPKNQVRNDEDALRGLAATIERDGLLQPITVRLNPNPLDVKYMIVAGERRWRAHRLLGRAEIQARVVAGESELSAARLRAVENLQRENLNPVQEARQYAELIELGLSQAEAAEMARVDQSTMSNRLRILRLPERVLAMIEGGKLTRAHGVALLRFEAWPKLLELIATIAANLGVGSKRLEKGLPFCRHTEVEEHVVEVWEPELPDEWRRDPAVFAADPDDDVACGNFYVLDVERWKKGVAKRAVERAKAEDAERAKRGAAPDAKANAARVAQEAAEARERSRARREKILADLAKANAAIRACKVPAGYLMAKLVEGAIAGGYSRGKIEEAFAVQGVRPTVGVLPNGGSQGMRDISAMRKMPPDALLRVAVSAILSREADLALKEPRMEVHSILGMAAYAPAEKKVVGGNRAGKALAAEKRTPGGRHKVAKLAKVIPRGKKKSTRTEITEDIKAAVKQMTEAGQTIQETAKRLCISAPSVFNIRKALGYVKPRVGAPVAQEGAAAK